MNRTRNIVASESDADGKATTTDSASAATQDPSRDVGTVFAAIGALVLLPSLALPWWGGVTGWNAFEAWDLVPTALAVTVLVAVAGRLGLGRRRPDSWLLVPGASTVVIVAENLINRPPIIQVASAVAGGKAGTGTGIWPDPPAVPSQSISPTTPVTRDLRGCMSRLGRSALARR